MQQYHQLIQRILEEGVKKEDRTGTGTISVFGHQMRFDLSKGFPIITTKKLHLKSIIYELLWFLNGETNIEYLAKHGVRIWDDWPFVKYKNSIEFGGETIIEFSNKIANDSAFAKKWGELGPIYGYQWRNWPTPNGEHIDQITQLIDTINYNPDSRRIIVSAWNVGQIEQMALPPCHAFFQFYVADGKLSCQLYQRSADVFLGVPFNIASYALFTLMICHVCGLEPGDFVHTLGDAHLYSNHIEQAKLLLSRDVKALPTIQINPDVKNIFDFKFEDFTLLNYNYHPHIKAEVAV